MIPRKISKSILTIGEDYKMPRGGISSVISIYSKYFAPFKFVSSYKAYKNKCFNVCYFPFSLFFVIKRLFLDKEIKIVHIHGAHNGSFFRKFLIFVLAKYVFNKKIIYHIHSSDFHIFYEKSDKAVKKLIEKFISNADLIICLSVEWRTFFQNNFSPKKIIILENIIEPAEIEIKKSPDGILKILFLGEIGERKGIFDLLEVIRKHKDYLWDKIRLTIGGNGDTHRVEKFIQHHSLQNLIKFEGWVSGEKKHQLLLKSDLFVLPSYNEGLPISILEAMSYKLAIISTNVGGINEIVKDNVNGYVLESGDKNSLFLTIKKFIEKPSLATEMGNNSSDLIFPYYSMSVIPKLQSIYLEISSRIS